MDFLEIEDYFNINKKLHLIYKLAFRKKKYLNTTFQAYNSNIAKIISKVNNYFTILS
jgi:hypothetical protein